MVGAVRCLSCEKPLDASTVKLSSKVVVCEECHASAGVFLQAVLKDIRDLHSMLETGIRGGLMSGELHNPLRVPSSTIERLALLIRWSGKPCRSNSTLPPSPLQLGSGEPLPPHVATLAAVGRRSSSSPTE